MTPSIAEDIQMLCTYWLDTKESSKNELMELQNAAERVEAYLSTFKPDHL